MEIDWFTLFAQLLNFLVLVWLLKRFLFGRILQAMDQREARIVGRLQEADQKRIEAEQEADRYRTANRELDAKREEMLSQAGEEAQRRRQQLIEQARADVDRLQSQWLEALQREKAELLQEFRERTGHQVLAVARRLLQDLAGADLEKQIVGVFLKHVQDLEPAERQALLDALTSADRQVELHSAFPLEADTRERLVKSLREQWGDDVEVRFEVEPSLGCGVELHVHSQRMVWNLTSYLDALEGSFFEGLEERVRENGKPTRNEIPASGDRGPEVRSRGDVHSS